MLSLRQRSAISINESFRQAATLEHDTSRGEFLHSFAIMARTGLPQKDNLLLGAISQLSEKSRLGARHSKIANEWGRNHAKPHERYNFFLCCVRYCFYFYFGSDALD